MSRRGRVRIATLPTVPSSSLGAGAGVATAVAVGRATVTSVGAAAGVAASSSGSGGFGPGEGTIAVTWDADPDPNVDDYRVELGSATGLADRYSVLMGGITSTTWQADVLTGHYWVRVRSMDGGVPGAASAEIEMDVV